VVVDQIEAGEPGLGSRIVRSCIGRQCQLRCVENDISVPVPPWCYGKIDQAGSRRLSHLGKPLKFAGLGLPEASKIASNNPNKYSSIPA